MARLVRWMLKMFQPTIIKYKPGAFDITVDALSGIEYNTPPAKESMLP